MSLKKALTCSGLRVRYLFTAKRFSSNVLTERVVKVLDIYNGTYIENEVDTKRIQALQEAGRTYY